MAIIKCKMCGGDLNLNEGASTAECEFCGSVQTIPNLDDEKKLVQFERAERLRKQCEFDKAAGIYETIVADFRQEAEAYWGLVLCKYGIEYVDDPATGKKVPTCHRSSFDSIMEDSDFEQALENADSTARKVYRDEAKAIEEIRKGIIAVSNNEKPYDIFICYKETDENGDRTLDSVLAQDVYDALADKGYRVFFSRISLEDKLGVEYEPYIFAALNSAKIMLAFGTDYEYFNAVWVKNEWSRFLKLMAKDKEKHLIPCFKGIDAYDMPKEFARLQAQDLGKVGAIQDLLRGIEKIIPRQAAQPTIVQERVVVGGSGDNKIASLLDRGNMALEDGDWAKADSFFEDVLNNDSKNAQAYLGKTLATEKCRTIDAFARKRKDASQNVRGETLELQPNRAHVDEMAKRFSLPGYVEQSEICKLYDFDLSYHSDVAERRQQYRNEEKFWVDHKWLSKAEKFAVGAVAEHLETEKKALFAALADRVKKAEAAEATEKQNVQARYEAHLCQVDELAEKLYNEGLARREKYYKELLQIAKTSSDVAELTETAEKFDSLGGYQDSKNLAEHCRKRAAEEQAKLEALEAKRKEEERIRQEEENQRLEQEKKRRIKRIKLVGVVTVAVIIAVVLMITVIIPGIHHKHAQKLVDAGQYKEAYDYLCHLGDSKSQRMLLDITAYGKYQVQTVADEINDKVYTFTYNEQGWLSAVHLGSDIYQKFIYTYYASGNVESVAIKTKDDKLLDQVWFYDRADSGIIFTPFEVNFGESDIYPQYKWYRYYGLSKKTVNAQYDETACVTYDENGIPTSIDLGRYNQRISGTKSSWKYETGNATGDTDVYYEVKTDKFGNYLKSIRTDVSTGSKSSYETTVAVEYAGKGGRIQKRTVTGSGIYSAFVDIAQMSGGAVPVAYTRYKNLSMTDVEQSLVIAWEWIDLATYRESILPERYASAEKHLAEEKYSVAIEEYEMLGNYQDSAQKIKLCNYSIANEMLANGNIRGAALLFGKAGDYSDARQQSITLWNQCAKRETVSLGNRSTVAVKTDGTVVATGNDEYGQCDVDQWQDIIAIGTGHNHTVGLKSDGTVVAAGDNGQGQCDVQQWTDIIAIAVGHSHTVGLKIDGTVVATGSNYEGICETASWVDVVEIVASANVTAGLKSDGTVITAGDRFKGAEPSDGNITGHTWQDVTALYITDELLFGLKADGTVTGSGSNAHDQAWVGEWKDIKHIGARDDLSVGLMSDGSVVVSGKSSNGEHRAEGWKNIVSVSVSTSHTVGLKSDGTVIAVGYNDDGECNVSGWTDIVSVYAGSSYTVGIKSDGTVVATGENFDGRCDVGDWKDIKIPD